MKLWNRLLACFMLHLTDVDRSGGKGPADSWWWHVSPLHSSYPIAVQTYLRSLIRRMITIMKTSERAAMFSLLVSLVGGGAVGGAGHVGMVMSVRWTDFDMNVVPSETAPWRAQWERQRRSVPAVTIVTTGSRTVTVGTLVTTVTY
jgi:hypothetical protein